MNAGITQLASACDRVTGVKLPLKEKSLLLLSYYAPTAGHDEDFLDSICSLSEFLVQHSSPGDQIIIGADSNCSSKSTRRRRDIWDNFCSRFELSVHAPPKPSFHHHNGQSESYIDIFAASTAMTISDIFQYCTLENPLNMSSHDPISTSICINLDISRKPSKHSDSYSEFRRQKVVWDKSKLLAYQELTAVEIQAALNYWSSPETLPLLSSLVSKILVKCALMVFVSNTPSYNISPKQPSLRIRQAQNILRNCFEKWKLAGKPSSKADPTRASYTEARRALQRLRRQVENLSNIKHNNSLMLLDRNNRSRIFALMKRYHGNKYSTTMTSVLHTPVGTYHDEDVLEGFAADAEHLARLNEENEIFDQGFYKLCKLDNCYIFEIISSEPLKLPPMTIADLNHILHKRMKMGKACDIYQVTVEHLRYCGDTTKLHILDLINRILQDIYYLSCPQIKLGIGSAIHKSKNKPVSRSNSWRRITVTPILGAIIDYYLDPKAEAVFRPSQSPDQLGFTAGISFLLAAIQRGECQRWAIDRKQTCFGVSLDGEAAFPSVERDIQVRELYAIGERGDILEYSSNTYKNTEFHMKLKDKLSRKVKEKKGNRQGHPRASGHFKVYINPCLLSLNSTSLGFHVGPLCSTAVCIADDAYLVSDRPSGLQGALDIISHYARRYQLRFNAEKTKIVVSGPKQDMTFYKETTPWTLNGEKVKVVEENEHLGMVVAGTGEEEKNVDRNITKCRASLFALLGPAFAFKCLLSPLVQLHLWRTCCLPVLLSGLPALPI